MNFDQVKKNMFLAMDREIEQIVDMYTFNDKWARVDVDTVATEIRHRRNSHRFAYSMELGTVRVRNSLNRLANEGRVQRHEAFESYRLNLPVRYSSVRHDKCTAEELLRK